jgi:hypothetical protein
MKIEIDWRPKREGQTSDFFGIRLYPETNEEMADLERFLSCKLQPSEYMRIINSDINYLIKFEEKKKFEYPKLKEKHFFWKRMLQHFK